MDLNKYLNNVAPSEPQYSKEEYAAMKKTEREAVWVQVDARMGEVLADAPALQEFLNFMSQCRNSLPNQLLLSGQNADITDARTFQQWKDAGRHIRWFRCAPTCRSRGGSWKRCGLLCGRRMGRARLFPLFGARQRDRRKAAGKPAGSLPFYSQVAENRIRQESNLQKTKRAAAEKKIKAAQHALERFEGEILKCLDGTSNFTEDMIAKQIRRYQQELDDAKAEYAELRNARLNEAAEIRKLRTYYDDFRGWAEEFDTAPLEMKRMILSHLIDRVEVGRKYQVIVKFNMKYRQFLECTAETYNTEIGA